MRRNDNPIMSRMPGVCIRTLFLLALAALGDIACAAEASPESLLEKYRCTICHSEREAAVGPAWADIATHYQGRRQANKLVADTIRSGAHGSGPWHMPPHPEVSKEDAAKMARYILAIRN